MKVKVKGKKKVAVFVSHIYGEMVREIQAGIVRAAAQNDIKLVFFAGFSDDFSRNYYSQYSDYDKGDIVTFMLPDLKSFDGIISLETSYPHFQIESINEIFKKVKHCPIVTLGGIEDFSYNIITDEIKSYSSVVEHLITEHGCRDIFHVGGDKNAFFTQDRIEAYRSALEKHGIPYDENKIIYGNLWKSCGDEIVEKILEMYRDREKPLPDAIACANDYSAIGVIDALTERGYNVPGEVLVTGYDNVDQARQGFPTITTCAQPFTEIGIKAVKVLLSAWRGEKVPHVTKEAGPICLGQSCGCMSINPSQDNQIRESYTNVLGRMEYLAQSTTNMILSLSSASSLEESFNQIENNLLIDTGFTNAILCLAPDWDQQRVIENGMDLHEECMQVVAGTYRGKPVKRETLRKGQLIPDELMESPEPFYIFPIHHVQYFMGYLIVTPELFGLNQLNVKSWLVTLGALLENRRIIQALGITVDRLENLSSRDMLTGLYNRRGYELFFKKYHDECQQNETGLAVFLVDIDNMKGINDIYGHAEGDYSICTVAKAMKAASISDEICVRTGGDEFVILAKNYNSDMVRKLKKNIRKQMKEITKKDDKPFDISVSIGCYCQVPTEIDEEASRDTLEEYLRKADKKMYSEKKRHKKI